MQENISESSDSTLSVCAYTPKFQLSHTYLRHNKGTHCITIVYTLCPCIPYSGEITVRFRIGFRVKPQRLVGGKEKATSGYYWNTVGSRAWLNMNGYKVGLCKTLSLAAPCLGLKMKNLHVRDVNGTALRCAFFV